MTHPITPPPELVQQLCDRAFLHGADGVSRGEIEVWLIQEAFRAGADRELEACCALLVQQGFDFVDDLRTARRPKLPSLKEQALDELHISFDRGYLKKEAADTIRRALEQING